MTKTDLNGRFSPVGTLWASFFAREVTIFGTYRHCAGAFYRRDFAAKSDIYQL